MSSDATGSSESIRRKCVAVEISDSGLRDAVVGVAAHVGLQVVALDSAKSHLVVMAFVDEAAAPMLHQHAVTAPVTVVAQHSNISVWQVAESVAAEHVVVLPDGSEWLQRTLNSLAQASSAQAAMLTVIGARGGCGATSLAVGLARATIARGLTVLVDGDDAGPGIDLSLGLENDEGLRWSDVSAVRGPLAPAALAGRLVCLDGLDVMACRPPTNLRHSWDPMMQSFRRSHEIVVTDLPRYQLRQRCFDNTAAAVILMTSMDLVGVHAARALVDSGRLGRQPLVALRTDRGPMTLKSALAALRGFTVIEVPTTRRISGAADFGDLAQAVSVGSFGRTCRAVVDRVLS